MGHHCCGKQKVKRGLWSPEEDDKLINHITTHGHGSWSSVPKLAGLQRCGKSCRLRWINYLRPDLKRGTFTEEEERTIIEVHRILGNRWAQIAKHLPGRTDNEVKNFWNSCIKKKLLAQGLDPNTHNLLPSKTSKKLNQNWNSKPTMRRMPLNCGSLIFDNSTNNHLLETIETAIDSQNVSNDSVWNKIKDVKTSNGITNNTQCHINSSGYMIGENSTWSSTGLENIAKPLVASAEVIMQPREETSYYDKSLEGFQSFDALFGSPCFEYGFGDCSPAIISDCLYGELGYPAIDQVAWGSC